MGTPIRIATLMLAAAMFCVTSRPARTDEPTFHGVVCTKDCSGHIAGYQWAEKHGITNVGNCGGKSLSFIQGCMIYAREHQETSNRAQLARTSEVRSCADLRDQCRRACEAANELETAARRLASCADQQALDDSCDSQFRAVRNAHDEYEDAVSNGSCDE